MPSVPATMKVLLILSENSSKIDIKLFPLCAISHETRAIVKYFVSYCLCKSFFDCNSPQTTSNLITLTFLVTLRPFNCFNLKLEQLSGKKVLKFALLGNCFSDLEMWY